MTSGGQDIELQLSSRAFARFSSYITAELGIKMPESKLPLIQSRLLRRIRELGLGSLEAYGEYLFTSPAAERERIHFIDAITTNKTDFFREADHFNYLTRTVLPTLERELEQQRSWSLRIWSAGCSTGEEPYTLAMVLSEYARLHPGFDFAILATDISTRVLEKAREGIYPESLIEPVPAEIRKRYLLRSRDRTEPLVRIRPELRQKVSLHRLNFMDDDYGVRDTFHVIFCRNVMIYFEKTTQEAVINKLCRNLMPGGFLFLGHSESVAGLNLPVVPVSIATYRKPRDV